MAVPAILADNPNTAAPPKDGDAPGETRDALGGCSDLSSADAFPDSPPTVAKVTPSPTNIRHARLLRQRSSTVAASPTRQWKSRDPLCSSGTGDGRNASSPRSPLGVGRGRRASTASHSDRGSKFLLMSPGQRGIDADFRTSGRVRTGSSGVLARLRSRSRHRSSSAANSGSVYEDTLDIEEIREVRGHRFACCIELTAAT